MCFVIHPEHPTIKVAKRDIVCYKYGFLRTSHLGIVGFEARYQPFVYSIGKLYSQRKEDWHENWPIVWHRELFDDYIIKEGFHSYSNKKVLERLVRKCSFTKVKCIIPKGAKYFYNPNDKEYVSNQIIIQEFIDNGYGKSRSV